jgi:hypothetical protein
VASDELLQGIVYIAEELDDAAVRGPTRYYGHWEAENRGGVLEQGPGWDDVEEAIVWGRARAPVVLLRLGTQAPQTHFSAGHKEPEGIPPPGGLRPWPALDEKNEGPQ